MCGKLAGLLLLAAVASEAQPAVPTRGDLLIATDRTRDAAFSQTVIVLLQHGRNRSVGVVLNRPLGESSATLFPDLKRTDPLWAGGPVAIGINALAGGRTPAPGGSVVLPAVWLVVDRTRMRELISASARPVRVYVGLCNWGPGQLDNELDRGLWRITAGSAAVIFDSRPETLWQRLSAKKTARIVGTRRAASTPAERRTFLPDQLQRYLQRACVAGQQRCGVRE